MGLRLRTALVTIVSFMAGNYVEGWQWQPARATSNPGSEDQATLCRQPKTDDVTMVS